MKQGDGKEDLKMFVWTEVLYEATPGMICVLASNLAEAHTIAKKELELWESGSMQYEPTAVYDQPKAVRCWGSS